ncbi:MAG: hypothetical protein E7254_09290 [Lachnospiraceae bacterium]|nr:hypothetical protein [Lachnospiraceae bacterium]
MKNQSMNMLKRGICVALSFALIVSVMFFADYTDTNAAKEQFQTETDENYENPNTKNFLLYAEDMFVITGRGVVFTGRVLQGVLKVGDKIKVTNYENGKYVDYEMTVEGLEMFQKSIDQIESGDNAGILVGWPFGEEAKKGNLERGAVIQGIDSPIKASKTVTGVFEPVESGYSGTIGKGFEANAYSGYKDYSCKLLDVNGSGIAAGDAPRYGVVLGDFQYGGIVAYPGMEISIRKEGKVYGTFHVVTTEIIEEETTEIVTEKSTEKVTNVAKKANTITVKAKKVKAKFKIVKKKKQVISNAIKVSNAFGKVTYKKVSKGSSPRLSVNKKTGKITVKKKTKKGNYKIVVKVYAAGNNEYLPATKTVTVKVKVK